MSAAPLLQLHGLSLRLGPVWALRDLDLRLQAGDRLALVGANGSGKTSLLRVLHGLRPPTEGRLSWHQPLRQAMLFQRPHLLRCSVRHNVALGLWLAGQPWRQARARALQVLERVGLAELADRRASVLSGGQQQRVALARAWALEPQLLLLDEPTASLDPHAKREVEALLGRISHDSGPEPMTLVFASHNLGQVKRLASRVVYLEGGRILADLPVNDFFNDALLAVNHPEAQAFVRGEVA